MKVHLVTLLLFSLAQGCANNDCSDSQPPQPAALNFYITDNKGINLVKDQNSIYHPDSIRLFLNRNQTLLQRNFDTQSGGYLFTTYPGERTSGGQLYQLYLNQSDSDSLEVLYTVTEGECFPVLRFTVFFFNGRQVYPDGKTNTLKLVK